ncbi:RBBP9/YdeN family alpha/beta hydrolase [Pseudaquabacterium terrae]|nr:alpha/beta hydrolase [Aquabacterium terrae]
MRMLLLPGWQDSAAGHWQSRWEQLHGAERVQQNDWWWPRRGDWMARLEEALLADPRPALLIAHSLGCQLVAAWAAHSQQLGRVRGALLVALPDIARADMPPQLQAWAPIPTRRLPFKSTAVLSSDDPYCTLARGQQMAADWGCDVHAIGARGHINGDSGLGDWAEGWQLLMRLGAGAVEAST